MITYEGSKSSRLLNICIIELYIIKVWLVCIYILYIVKCFYTLCLIRAKTVYTHKRGQIYSICIYIGR